MMNALAAVICSTSARLTDKLGNMANAACEIEYHDAEAFLVGEEAKGVGTILSSAEYKRPRSASGRPHSGSSVPFTAVLHPGVWRAATSLSCTLARRVGLSQRG